MIVTAVEQAAKTRCRVFLDGEFAFTLYRGELRKYGIIENKELSEEDFLELRTQVLPKRAKLRAMNLLKSRQYTEKQLLDKLLLGGYTQELAQEAVDYVKSYRYIDDVRYAYDYMLCHMESRSRKEIEQKLQQKGVSKENIKQALDQYMEYEQLPDEKDMIRKMLEKKHCLGRTLDEKEKRRIYGFFYRKGFSQEAVKCVLRENEPDMR